MLCGFGFPMVYPHRLMCCFQRFSGQKVGRAKHTFFLGGWSDRTRLVGPWCHPSCCYVLCPYRLICSNLLTGSFLGHQIYKTQSLWLIMISLVPYLDIHVAWPTEIGKWAHGFNGIYPWASFGPVYLRIVWAASEYALYYVKCEKMRYMNESIHIYCIYIYHYICDMIYDYVLPFGN